MKPCQGSLFNIGEQEVEQFTWVNDVRKYLLSQNLPVRWITEVVEKPRLIWMNMHINIK